MPNAQARKKSEISECVQASAKPEAEIVNGSKPYSFAASDARQVDLPCALQRCVSPHPSPLPRGAGERCSARSTIQSYGLCHAQGALFPLPKGEGQGEGKWRESPAGVSDHSRNYRTGRILRRSRRLA